MLHCLPTVAIVGIAAELPSGTHNAKNLDHDGFFQFLLSKGESYEYIPKDRFNTDAFHGRASGQVLPRKGSFLKELDLFDPAEFGIAAKDAQHMAVATRKLLETTFLALLDSGIDYRGRNIGCYTSGVSHDLHMTCGQDEYEARGSFAGSPSMVANRVSYYLDLRGPSIPVDTACSSSLTALHLAAQAIRTGECEAAVVGGCQINLRFVDWVNYSQGGILSEDGKCKPFDANADGFSRGEGVVCIVLKPLDAALRDNDKIYGCVLGSAINSTGSLAPVSAPVAAAQQAAMEAAFRQAGRSPHEVDFLELHATGTAKGDPTEANWVGPLFQRNGEVLLGSVKGNIGHLEITAFLASLSKVLSIFETGLIPPNANLINPNPAIEWDAYRLRVPTEATPLPKRNGRAIVAMTSSGIGGANGSLVIESPPERTGRCSDVEFWTSNASNRPHLFLCGGLSPRTASVIAQGLQLQREEGGMEEEALTLTYGRRARSMPWINYAVAPSNETAHFSEAVLVPKTRGPLVFVFSGQGPQHHAMGRELFRASNIFRKSILECDAIHERMTGYSLILKYGLFDECVEPENLLDDIWPIAVTLPALTMIQLALMDTLSFIGLKPDVVVGHSAGETAVLYASGAASKEMVVQLSIARGRGLTPLEDLGGSMVAINCTLNEAEEIIAQVTDQLGSGVLEIGCYNDAHAFTLSGSNAQLDRAVQIATKNGIFARKLKTRVAVHSSMMEHCREVYRKGVNSVFASHKLVQPVATIYSAALGEVMHEAGYSEYFWKNSRGAVHFSQAIQAIIKEYPAAAFLEIGPHPVLSGYLSSLAGLDAIVACPLRRVNPKKPETDVELTSFLTAIGQMAIAGHHIDFSSLVSSNTRTLSHCPAYPFQRKSLPVILPTPEIQRIVRDRNGPLNFPELCVNTATHPSLSDHIIKSTPIMPAAGYIEMALEFGARKLWNVTFVSMLSLAAPRPTPIQIHLENSHWTIRSASSHTRGADGQLHYDSLHSRGFLSTNLDDLEKFPMPLDVESIRSRCQPFDVPRFYNDIKYFADYGTTYKRVRGIYVNDTEALIEIEGSTLETKRDPAYIFHPAILDAAYHFAIHGLMTAHRDTQVYYLPATARIITVHNALSEGIPEKLVSHLVRRSWTPTFIEFDCVVATTAGTKLMTLEGLGLERHGSTFLNEPSQRYDLAYNTTQVAVSRTVSADTLRLAGSSSVHVFIYKRGEEMIVQKKFRELQIWEHHFVWFVASLDDAGACGFTRSLRREYTGWTVKLVSFDASWTSQERDTAMRQLVAMQDQIEDEVAIDAEGRVCVPRLVLASGPPQTVAFDPSQPWTVRNDRIVHVDQSVMADSDESHAVVELLAVSEGAGGLREFIGRDIKTQDILMGITEGPLSNLSTVTKEACLEVSAAAAQAQDVPPFLAIAVVALGLGQGALVRPERFRALFPNSPVIVTHAGAVIGRAICEILTSLRIQFTPLASDYDLSVLRVQNASVVLSAYEDAASNQALAVTLADNGRLFMWSHATSGIVATLRAQPWLIHDAVRYAVNNPLFGALSKVPVVPPLQVIAARPAPGLQVDSDRHLFHSTKSYLLVGGLGSLGIDIAWWMYENGARHVVLTSRTGRQKLVERGEIKAQQMLSHLESLSDLDVRVASVDALSVQDMSALVSSIKEPLGGCMVLSGLTIDKAFARQDEKSFELIFEAKVGVTKALEQVIDIDSLDWLIGFTSVSGLFGSAGQTNYASANTALDGLLRSYSNAFSLVSPLIIDSNAAMDLSHLGHFKTWAFTTRQLCTCIADGIRKLASEPFWLYVPHFDWTEVGVKLGVSPVFEHLLEHRTNSSSPMANDRSIEDIVALHLEVAREDLSWERPLTSYGLDSISAAQLAHALRHFAPMTQLQLLGHVSVNDIYRRAEAEASNRAEKAEEMQWLFDWTTFNEPGRPLIKCLDSKDTDVVPLILMHGTSGSGLAFSGLQAHFSTPLWFLQATPDTPFTSMETLVAFYMASIKQMRPQGPYRLAVYCATSVIAVELVRALEAQGDEVLQFVFIDHVPTMFCLPDFVLDASTLRTRLVDEDSMDRFFGTLMATFDDTSPSEAQFRVEMEAAWAGATDASKLVQDYCFYFRRIAETIVQHNMSLVPECPDDPALFTEALRKALSARVRDIRAPKSVWVASNGMIVATGEPIERWGDMGIEARDIFTCSGSHRAVFYQEALSRGIEFDWSS